MALKQRTSSNPAAAAAAPAFRLFAPWRFDYVKRSGAPKECIFCFGQLSEADRRKRLVVFDHHDAVVMLNRYPYTNGHLMVAPRRHVASPELLRPSERHLLSDLVAKVVEVMRPL